MNKTINLTIYCKRTNAILENEEKKENILTIRGLLLSELNYHSEFKEDDYFWFFEEYEVTTNEFENTLARINSYKESFQKLGAFIEAEYRTEIKYAGSIDLGREVMVSDPCYDLDTWCAGSLDNVLPGKYNCFYQEINTGRTCRILVLHESYDKSTADKMSFTNKEDFVVGVDSGTCGIYNLQYFADHCKEEAWYDGIIEQKLPGIYEDSCFITDTGYGDGGYSCYTNRNNEGKIDAIEIVFIE